MAKACDVQNSWMILRKKELILLRIVGNYLSELLIKGYLLWFGNQFFEVASKEMKTQVVKSDQKRQFGWL